MCLRTLPVPFAGGYQWTIQVEWNVSKHGKHHHQLCTRPPGLFTCAVSGNTPCPMCNLGLLNVHIAMLLSVPDPRRQQ